jgi:enamine deaminase RidA (YjgF/YER057c/UK114 family)
MEIKRLHVGKRLSETAIHNGTVYLAGQIADDTTQDIAGQTREVLGHVDRLLAEAGSDKTRILSCQIYIADMAHFPGMNEGLGRLGRAGPHAAARHRRSEAGESGLPGRDRRRRRTGVRPYGIDCRARRRHHPAGPRPRP